MKTQNAVLLAELRRRPVTVYYAMNKLGIGCPTKRISELRKGNWNIETRKTKMKTRWGKAMIATWVLK
jgi:Helix-turn-helix domain